jgi:hypothetical protein
MKLNKLLLNSFLLICLPILINVNSLSAINNEPETPNLNPSFNHNLHNHKKPLPKGENFNFRNNINVNNYESLTKDNKENDRPQEPKIFEQPLLNPVKVDDYE